MIVIGGTMGASVVGSSLDDLYELGTLLRINFLSSEIRFHEVVSTLVHCARTARKSGLLALEDALKEIGHPFIRKGMQLLVDGTPPELLREIMEIDLENTLKRQQNSVNIVKRMAGYSPTFGIIGTVLSLIYTIGGITNLESMAENIALAFVATFWGILMANVLYLPLANKLEYRFQESQLMKEMVLDGLLSIQASVNPTVLAEKLESYLPLKMRVLSTRQTEPPA